MTTFQNEQAAATLDVLKTIRTKAMKATISSETDTSRQYYAIEDLMDMEDVNNIEIFKIDIEGESHASTYVRMEDCPRRFFTSGSEFSVVPAFLKKHKPAQVRTFSFTAIFYISGHTSHCELPNKRLLCSRLLTVWDEC